MSDLANWQPLARPKRLVLEGAYVRLEPLSAKDHADQLFEVSTTSLAVERFRWLPVDAPKDREVFDAWIENVVAYKEAVYFAVINLATGKVEGRQSLMRIDEGNGVVEIGDIYWGEAISRTPVTTECLYLFARYIFDELGYRRFEWKCNDLNEPSKRAARRFGFTYEGTFRQAAVVKGQNRDTAWFSMLDSEWPVLRLAFEDWLSLSNFDGDGRQVSKLGAFIDRRKAEQ